MTEIISSIPLDDGGSITLINNAATVAPLNDIENCTSEDIISSITTNLISPAILISTFINLTFMRKTRRNIVNITSGSALYPAEGMSLYCAAKAGLNMLTRCVGLEQNKDNPVNIELPYHDTNWLSSNEELYFTQTFPSGFTWMKGKWLIHSFPVEVVQISNSAGIPEGIWEGGQYIWQYVKGVKFEEFVVPVVPLEIQLESNMRRGREDRTKSILNALQRNGYDRSLLAKALSTKHLERIDVIRN